MKNKLLEVKKRRVLRTRSKTIGTPERPRLTVYRSNKHVYAQIIDDSQHKTLVSFADILLSNGKDVKKTKQEKASETGKKLAEIAKKKNIVAIVFDRGSYRYHGRVKALADGARAGGLQF